MERPLTVGQLARAIGVPAKTIRYYDQVGVLPVPRRSDAGYRHYSRHDVHRLQTTAPASHADGCQCLGSETSAAQEPPPYPYHGKEQ